MGYETLLEQIKAVCARNSLTHDQKGQRLGLRKEI